MLFWYPSELTLKKSFHAFTFILRCKNEFELEDLVSVSSYLVNKTEDRSKLRVTSGRSGGVNEGKEEANVEALTLKDKAADFL